MFKPVSKMLQLFNALRVGKSNVGMKGRVNIFKDILFHVCAEVL